MSLLLVGMDVTIVNVALPSIRSDLNVSLSGLQWTIDAYILVLASLLMLAGSTADRLGRRRTFQTGLVVFTAGSLLCSLAPGLGWLIAFRMVQAVGASMLNPVAMSIITNVFTEPRERARAIGVWGGVVGISLGLGPDRGMDPPTGHHRHQRSSGTDRHHREQASPRHRSTGRNPRLGPRTLSHPAHRAVAR